MVFEAFKPRVSKELSPEEKEEKLRGYIQHLSSNGQQIARELVKQGYSFAAAAKMAQVAVLRGENPALENYERRNPSPTVTGITDGVEASPEITSQPTLPGLEFISELSSPIKPVIGIVSPINNTGKTENRTLPGQEETEEDPWIHRPGRDWDN